jgi:hypothetical protein
MTMKASVLLAVAVLLAACGDDTGQQLAKCKDQIMVKSRDALASSVSPMMAPLAMKMVEDRIGALPNTPEGVSQCRSMLAQR